jgi:hypothetical protein
VALAIAGAADSLKQYIEYDKVLEAHSSVSINNLFLQAGDVIRVYGSVEEVTFTVMGTENG